MNNLMIRKIKTQICKFNSFDDVYKCLDKKTRRIKGLVFEYLTKCIFEFHPMFTHMIKKAYLYDHIPIHLKENFNLPCKDMGIDLLLQTYENEYIPVQSKYRSNKFLTVSWKELSTFVGQCFGINNEFKRGVYVTNTYGINAEIKKAEHIDKIICLYGEFFDNLDKSFFDICREHFRKNNKPKRIPFQPREYQENIKNLAIDYFKGQDKGYVQMACGSGKTLTSCYIDDKMINNWTLFLVPSLYLLSQSFREFANYYYDGDDIKFLLIGSDCDVEKGEEYIKNGLFLSTDEKEIYDKLSKVNNKKVIIISTYQSSDKLKYTFDELNHNIDFAVFDEAHKTCGSRNSKFAYLLNDENIQVKKRLFMTATPRMYKSKGDSFGIFGMNNEKVYGKEIGKYSIRQGIDNGWLCDYQIVVLNITNEEIKKSFENNKLITVNNNSTDSYHLACALAINKAMEKIGCTHVLPYCNSIRNSKKFVRLYKTINRDANVFHMDGKMSATKRKQYVDSFINSESGVLSSARVLNEGINIKIVDGICFIDPRKSTQDIVQCIGRMLRLHDNKKISTIIVPTIVDDINDIDEGTVFGNLISVIKSLSEHDDAVIEYFKARKNGDKMNKKLIKYYSFKDGKIDVDDDVEFDEWRKWIELSIFRRVDNWEYQYDELVKFVRENDRLPKRTITNNTEEQIAIWTNRMKQLYRKNQLPICRTTKLEFIKGWYWNKEKQWNNTFKEFENWVNVNNKFPNCRSKNQDEILLSNWMFNVKKKYVFGDLSIDKISKMASIENWYWNKEDLWYEKYDQLKYWINNNDKFPDKRSSNLLEKSLAYWIGDQRKKYKSNGDTEKKKKHKLGTLSAKEVSLLEKLSNWYWDINDLSWINSFESLKIFCVKNKKIPSANSKLKTEKILGTWAQEQRKKYRKKMLSQNKINKLENIPCWFWEKNLDEIWRSNYNKIVTWINVNNQFPNCMSSNKNEKILGSWIMSQRSRRKQKKLSKERIVMLENINGWNWHKNELWCNKYQEFINFTKKHNKFPSSGSKDKVTKKMGKWRDHQKRRYKLGKLEQERIVLLEKINGWYW